jgi:hypothetical protein
MATAWALLLSRFIVRIVVRRFSAPSVIAQAKAARVAAVIRA